MNIQSSFNSGVEGFKKATETAYQAADNIAKSTAYDAEAFKNISESSSVINDNKSSNPTVNLTQSIVDLKVSEYQAKASANVIKTADENLGTLLDVTA